MAVIIIRVRTTYEWDWRSAHDLETNACIVMSRKRSWSSGWLYLSCAYQLQLLALLPLRIIPSQTPKTAMYYIMSVLFSSPKNTGWDCHDERQNKTHEKFMSSNALSLKLSEKEDDGFYAHRLALLSAMELRILCIKRQLLASLPLHTAHSSNTKIRRLACYVRSFLVSEKWQGVECITSAKTWKHSSHE